MNFSDRLNLIFREIDCSNAEVAALANIHPSGVSRFRSGERTPTPRSSQLRNLCTGIIEHAKANGKVPAVCKILNIDKTDSKEELSSHLLMWLLMDSFSFKFFSDKLNVIMNGIGISNSSMAAAVHVDASVISRFRNNVRTPSNDTILTDISRYIYEAALKNNKGEALISITDMPAELLGDEDRSVGHILSWFSGKSESVEHKMIASFLEKIDKFTPGAFPPLPELDLIAPEAIRNSGQDCYVGIAGLRQAVIRFLGNASVSKSPNTLLLYSDQTMEWMTGDPEYRKIWAALMVYTLRAKNKIRIIHNLERSLPEIVKAIEGWLPLYMSGLLEAYIHKKNVGERFAHTLFIAPEKEAVVASFPIGMEDEARYDYFTGDKVDYYVKQHDKLIASSVPLMRMFSPGDTEGLLLLQRKFAEGKGEQYRLLSSPSFETMSEATLAKILKRLGVGGEVRDKIEKHFAKKRELYLLAVSSGIVKEFIYAPGNDGSEDDAFGKVQINLGDLFLDEPLYYTKEEYDEHIKDMRALEARDSNYSFTLLSERYFENLQILSKKDAGALVIKTGRNPDISSYWHPIMANVYHTYLNELVGGKVYEVHGWD